MRHWLTAVTITLPLLTTDGADQPVWRIAGRGEDRQALATMSKPR
ncbi:MULTISPECIES: hypothetical protein [unclassified Streptomyces]